MACGSIAGCSVIALTGGCPVRNVTALNGGSIADCSVIALTGGSIADCSVIALTGGCPGLASPRAAARCLHCVRQPVGPAQTVHPWPGCAFRPRPVGESWLPLFVQRCGCSGQGTHRSAFATSCCLYKKAGAARFFSGLVIPVQGGGSCSAHGSVTDRSPDYRRNIPERKK